MGQEGKRFIFEVLNKAIHNRNNFDCGVLELNEFIAKYARKQQENHLNTVYVAVQNDINVPKTILGYYTLSTNSLSFKDLPNDAVKNIPQNYPISTIKIGRLARDIRKTKSGFGDIILGDALYRALTISRTVGVFAIDVDAKNNQVKAFYKKNGFIELQDDPLGLILPIKTLEKAMKID